jgi:hypothetical protein
MPITTSPRDRDGTSRAERRLTALEPDSVSVDERTVRDWLKLVRRYAEELRYWDEANREDGDWSGFLPEQLELDDIVAFLEHPEAFDPESHPLLHRPHFSLLLVFLELLQRATGRLNTFTRRHLDFYYRQVLRLAPEPAVPDRVRVLFELAPDVDQARLPAGTRLNAGPDSTGVDRHYATERDLVVNRARIARLSSIHLERRVTDLERARQVHRNDRDRTIVALFELALGDPRPGDPLPEYPDGTEVIDFSFLEGLHDLLKLREQIFFPRLHELRDLMRLKQRRDEADREAVRRLIAQAEGVSFDGLPDVDDLDDLYQERGREDVREFIVDTLGETLADFNRVMGQKVALDNGWDRIRSLLTRAARRRDPEWELDEEIYEFDPLLESAVLPENLDKLPEGDLEVYWREILDLEAYFFMTAVEYAYVLRTTREAATSQPPTPAQWAKVDGVLIEAHRHKVWAGRRAVLERIRTEHGFDSMLRHALGGEPVEGEDLKALDLLEPYFGSASDRADLAWAREERDWPRAVEIVEVAWRNREGLPPPVPRREEWINLHPAANATAVRAELGISGELGWWKTFGGVPPTPATPPPPVLGWAVSSPILALAEGKRTIKLVLGCDPETFDIDALRELFEDESPLRVQVSTQKGWIEPSTLEVKTSSSYVQLGGETRATPALRGIRFILGLPQDADAIAAPADGSHAQPTLRLMLRPIAETDGSGDKVITYRARYTELRDLRLRAVHVAVEANGLQSVTARNDEGIVDAAQPFEPFGASPATGSRFAFGHPELVAKRLDSVKLRLSWMGLPDDLATYYDGYDLGDAVDFTVQVRLVDRRQPHELKHVAPLFDRSNDDEEMLSVGTIAVANVDSALPDGYRYRAREVDTSHDDPHSWGRYLEWQLNAPDFQHRAYPAVATRKSVAMATAIANDESVDAAHYQVNPPYTPQLGALEIDYTSSLEIDLSAEDVAEEGRILHVHPFGTHDALVERDESVEHSAEGVPFLPRYEDEGELLIGLDGVRAPQTVTLFFQMAEGSADPDLQRQPVRWWHLAGDRWTSLDAGGGVLSDGTRGLTNSGVVELALEPAEASTRLPGDLYWLRASVSSDSAALCNTVAIHAQAVAALFVDRGNAPDHFRQPLAAESITDLVEPRPEVAAVFQPYTSFGGRPSEEANVFDTRVSERLRHKGRALTAWDYERLVLGRFPEIYKVKCIPAHPEPGRVGVVVIPDVRNRLPFDPFQPRAPADLLADIEGFLSTRAPASARITVKNPRYVAVKIRVAVRFRKAGNEELDKRRLTEDLNRHLSPWAYDEGADLVIGGKIYAHSLVDFLDRRPYVDHLADVRLFRSDDGETFVAAPTADEEGHAVEADPDAILVAAREHQIDLIPETGYQADRLTGIGFMQIELDFVVA